MGFAPLNLTISSILKEIIVLKSLLLETQKVLDRGTIKLLHDKALNTVNLLAHGEIFLRKDELEEKLNNQFDAFSAANDATILFLNELLKAKQEVLTQKRDILKSYIELKLQISGGKNYTYNPVLTSYLKDDQDFINRIKNILHRFTDFKYPALMVGKDYLSLSDNIVSNDQLYVLFPEAEASHFDLLYNPVYVNSIRKYFYKNNNTNIFAALPENQFSLITSTVFEDTTPDSQIVDYFKSIKSLLRPGGCLFFTFFDYTNVASFELVEQITQAGSNIMDPDVVLPAIRFYDDYKRIIEGLGMSIDMLIQGNTHNLMVVRKDGELKSIKAKKVIGEIITV
jgi:hypothetical protein